MIERDEMELLDLLLRRMSLKVIACRLGVSYNQALWRERKIYRRLGITCRRELWPAWLKLEAGSGLKWSKREKTLEHVS